MKLTTTITEIRYNGATAGFFDSRQSATWYITALLESDDDYDPNLFFKYDHPVFNLTEEDLEK